MSLLPYDTAISDAQIVVIKIGSALLVQPDGTLRDNWLKALAADVTKLRADGKQLILVSSGSIALGNSVLSIKGRSTRLEEAQAAASVGQIQLAQAYQGTFACHDIVTAQILLTLGDLEDRPRYLNARNTVKELLERGVIPVINENDTVATSEIRFGDNDRLAARVAQMASADTLLLLSDIDGLYDADPRTAAEAKFIPVVDAVTPNIEALAGPPAQQGVGSGGMITKLGAAKIALAGGCSMIIMNGTENSPVSRLLAGERCTLFPANASPLAIRKRWIQGMMAPKGMLHIDAGAVSALARGASLLPVGIIETLGDFSRGDLVAFVGPDGEIVGQGLTAYGFEDALKLEGRNMSDAAKILGYVGRSALVHRDDLILF